MKFDAIKGLIGAVAPTIGQALGGPLGGCCGTNYRQCAWL